MFCRLRRTSFFALILFASSALAETRYIMETATAADAAVAARRHRLTLLGTSVASSRAVSKVSVPAPLPLIQVRQITADPLVREFELDRDLNSPEANRGAGQARSIQTLPPSAFSRATVNFFGSVVRNSYANQPATQMIQSTLAQARYGAGVGIIAVIDTGVDPTHPVLRNSLVAGYDFVRDRSGVANEMLDVNQSTVGILDSLDGLGQSTVGILDSGDVPVDLNQSTVGILDSVAVARHGRPSLPPGFGHGTMVAGLIHLVAPRALIMPIKAFDANGVGQLSDIVRAVYFAADHGATVINMSFNLTAPSSQLTAAIRHANSRGVVCIASAGNDGRKIVVYPAGSDKVVGVSSVNNLDQRSPFTNYGTESEETAAPGEALVTAYPGGNYAGVWGTSFSAALVSGAVALLPQYGFVNSERASKALEHGDPISEELGKARLNVFKSLQYFIAH
jgi:subtilisin family serine protease